MSAVKLQVNVSGYLGEPSTVLAIVDVPHVLVAKKLAFKSERLDDAMLCLTYAPAHSVGDIAFTDADLSKAIALCFDLYARKNLVFLDSLPNAGQLDPRTRVQVYKVTETGKDYRLSNDITNDQVALLCIAWASHVVTAQETSQSFSAEINEVLDQYFYI